MARQSKYTLLKNKEGDRSIRINKTGEIISEKYDASLYAELRKKALANHKAKSYRSAMDAAADACGLTKVYGAVSGKVYYE